MLGDRRASILLEARSGAVEQIKPAATYVDIGPDGAAETNPANVSREIAEEWVSHVGTC